MNYTNRTRFFFINKAILSFKNCSLFFFVLILINFLGITSSVYSKTPQIITFPAIGEQSFLNHDQNIMADTSHGHNLFVKTDSTAWAEGFNFYGQLGNGKTSNSYSAVQIMSGVASAAAGGTHSLFLKTDGTVWAAGNNDVGQLGAGDTNSQSTPVYIMSGVASVAAGEGHSLVLKTDGTAWAFGRNNKGQIGNGSFIDQSIPVQVMSSVAAICAGYEHSLFIKTDGTVWAFGENNKGQLGNGSFVNQSTPVKVMGDVASVYAGSGNSIFLKSDNTAWVVGDNSGGQLGDGNKGNIHTRAIPIQVMSNVVSAALGGTYSLFLKSDGTVWASGFNGYNNFGDGSETYDVTIPVQVMSGVTAVDAAYGGPTNSRSLFLKNDGTVWTAGSNLSYEFGTSNIHKNVIPVRILDGIVNPKITLAATTSSGLAITYAVVSGPANLSGTTLTLTGKGAVTVSASQAGNSIYEPTTTTQTFTVSKVAQTIIFPAIESRLMTSPSVSFIGAAAATSSSSLTVTYSVVDGPATLSGRALTLTGAGTVTVRASQDGNRAYEAAVSVDRTFTVAKVSQVITFPPIGNRLFSTSNIALNATAASGLPVNYSIVSGSASVSGSSLTVTGAGLITVKASQGGNSTYHPAPDVTLSFMVTSNTSPPTWIALSKSWFYDIVGIGEVAVLSSVDPDNGDSFEYTLVGGAGATDNAKFSILGDRLKGATAFNHNTQSNFTIRVRVADSAGQAYEKVLTLKLLPSSPSAKFIPAGVPFTESPNYVNAFFQLVSKSTGRSISYPRSFFDPSSTDYQPDLFQVYEGATLSSSTTPIGFNESYFQVGKITDVPTKIRTVILLDTSSSISIEDLAKIKDAAKVMVNNMFEQQEIAIYSFSETHTKIQDFLGKSNANQATLKAAIDKIARGNESTNLYGSMLAMLKLPAWLESFSMDGIETGFLVALTDGADTSGSATKEQVIAKRDLDIKRIYTIGLGAAVEPAILQELQNTNFYIPASNTAVLAAAFENIQRDIIDLANSYYRINYISPKRLSNPLGTLRKMEVRLKNNTNTAADRMLSTAFNSDSFTSLGPAMYINRSVDKVAGISALAVSRDLPSSASAITLFPPLDFSNFTWSIGNPALATLTPRGTIGERVIITPKGQNGTTTLTLTDTISNFTKTIPLIIRSGSPLIAQTITFPALTSRLTTSSPFDLGASASSGLAVKFTLVSGPATLSGKKVALTGRAGTVVIRTSQAGNATYAAATPVERSFAVTVPSSISALSKLAMQGATLSPAFKTSTQTYTAKVANSKRSIKVTATAKSTSAKIAVNGTTAKSGTAKTIWLKVGRNPISIVVTAQNGSKRTYKITLTRAAAASSAPKFTPGPAGFALGVSGVSTTAAPRAVTSVERIGGLKYLAIEIQKPAGQLLLRPRVEVSSDLVKWFSGKNHTTVLSETTAVLRVRDNTPLEPGSKRFIRVQPKSKSFNGEGD